MNFINNEPAISQDMGYTEYLKLKSFTMWLKTTIIMEIKVYKQLLEKGHAEECIEEINKYLRSLGEEVKNE